MSNTIKVIYNSSVHVAAGWRSVEIMAEVELNKSGKKGAVLNVLEIDGETPSCGMSRTGASRQKYNGNSIAEREVGAVKIISKCKKVENGE